MLRSMFAAVSGLRAHQNMMDVVGNNIANVNTVGYKSSRATFSDTLSQLLSGGAVGNADHGGVNPQQIGLGVRVSSIDLNMAQGSTQMTGRNGDLAIQGEGLFAVRNGQDVLFTRAGSFNFDASGNLVAANGAIVQGWNWNAVTKSVDVNQPISDIRIPVQAFPPQATTDVTIGGNLSNNAVAGDKVNTAVDIVDSLGTTHRINMVFTKTANANEWTQDVSDDKGNLLGSTTLQFDATTGALSSPATPPSFSYTPTTGAGVVNFTTSFGTAGAPGALTQYGGDNSAAAIGQDGVETGYLRSISFGQDGSISGVFTNGEIMQLAQIATALFQQPGGLQKAGDSMYQATVASGAPAYGPVGTAGRGVVAPGAVEASNVDLAAEFTNLILAQRGYQANARVMTTSDEMLQELAQLKR